MSGPSDEDLLDAWRAGSEDAGQALLKRNFDAMYRFFRNKVGEDCDDLIQSTFLAAVHSKDAFAGRSSFRTYLFVIARHELYRYLRERARDRMRFDSGISSIEEVAPSPSTAAASRDLRSLVLAALRRLPVDMQVALELHYWEDLRTRELADALEVPESTIKSRLQRGRRALEKELRRSLRSAGMPADRIDIEAALGL